MTSRRLPCSRVPLALILAAVIIAAPGCTGGDPSSPRLKDSIVRAIGTRLEKRAFALETDWADWDAHVQAHRAALDAAMTEEALEAALDDALAEFGVSHLWVWTPQQMRLRKQGRQGGLGLKTVGVAGGRLVTAVLPEGAGGAAGLRRGDVVVSVDGAPVGGEFASGVIGETVSLDWTRDGERFGADVVYGSARRAPPPSLRWLESDIAWITVPTFAYGVYETRTIDALFRRAGGARALVLDLRSNGGGRLSNVEHLLGHVVEPRRPLFGEIYREQYDLFLRHVGREPASIVELLETTGQTVRAPGAGTGAPYLGPLAVVVDGRSGSGGDVFPATIQALGRGVVVGTPTLGMVLIGDDKRLPGGYVLFYPVGEMVRIDGQRMEAHPVQPDILLMAEETVDDATVARVVTAHFGAS